MRYINYSPALLFKKTIWFFLLLLPVYIHAQNDTTKLSDSLPQEIQEVPAEDPPIDHTISYGDTRNEYFLKKWGAPDDSFIIQRHIPDSIIRKMQTDDDFWYANAVIKEEKKPETKDPDYTPTGQQQWFQTLLWLVIIGGFAAAIMWYLAGSNVGLFRKKNRAIPSDGDDELSTEDIFAINYQKEIDKAEAVANYRLAIRLMFLRLLKNMADRNIIQYKPDRTNLDYLMQLHNTVYYDHFFRISRNYEYSWYGQFGIGEEAYRIIRNDFKQIDKQIQ